MFCSQCGKQSSGNFCWSCGSPLHQPEAAISSAAPASPNTAPANDPQDWSNETDYETLLQIPEVKDILARQLPPAKAMSGEDFVGVASKFIKTSVPMVPAMTLTHDLFVNMGIKTGKARLQKISRPTGRVVVAVLCSLARAGYKLRNVQQASNGCMLECSIPSDMFSLEGDLLIIVTREPEGSTVSATTRIGGQLYDWGKSSRCLNRLFADINKGI